MKTKTIRQQFRVYHWGGFSNGQKLPETTLGTVVVERTFKIDGEYLRLDEDALEYLISVNSTPCKYLWNWAVIYEFFPNFTGFEIEGEV